MTAILWSEESRPNLFIDREVSGGLVMGKSDEEHRSHAAGGKWVSVQVNSVRTIWWMGWLGRWGWGRPQGASLGGIVNTE